MARERGRVDSVARLSAVQRTGLLDTNPEPGYDRLAELAATLLDAPFAFVTVVDDHRSFWKAAIGLPPGSPRQNTVEESFCQYVIERPGRLLIDDVRLDPRTCDNPSIEGMGVVAWAGTTLRGPDGEALGSFCVVDTRPRTWTARDGEVLETLAEAATTQIALRETLERERHLAAFAEHRLEDELRAERDVTDALQTTLLPAGLPALPGLAAAARYRPADHRLKVGGDFYDLFEAGDGSVLAVVGDICGKGPRAAATTASARWTLRSEARHRSGPGELLAHLNEVLRTSREETAGEEYLTMIIARLATRPGGGFNVRVACAGHPPALLRGADGRAGVVGPPGVPLGILDEVHNPEADVELAPGSRLVLYTDGLLDARAPQRQLKPDDLLAAVGDEAPARIADRLVELAAGDQDARDDIALLVLAAE